MIKSCCILAFVTLSVCGCNAERATPKQCKAIFSRLVELELAEMGFQDQALTKRRQAEFTARYKNELKACVGREIPSGALECIKTAKTTEELSHDCLR